jgi:hypothetical protein
MRINSAYATQHRYIKPVNARSAVRMVCVNERVKRSEAGMSTIFQPMMPCSEFYACSAHLVAVPGVTDNSKLTVMLYWSFT